MSIILLKLTDYNYGKYSGEILSMNDASDSQGLIEAYKFWENVKTKKNLIIKMVWEVIYGSSEESGEKIKYYRT